jgi:hypothetical protein
MSSAAAPPAAVPWDELSHAYGAASDIPELLAAASKAKGFRLRSTVEKLWERVLHQGSIYSASAPVVRALLPIAACARAQDKLLLYELFAEFASSTRQAIRAGREIPCCSGGEPSDGEAILREILAARDRFAADLQHTTPKIRACAGDLLAASGDADSTAAQLVRARYVIETDPAVRGRLFEGLMRVGERFTDWREFLEAQLTRETDPANRFVLRYAQVCELKSEADSAAVNDLVATFVRADDSRFFAALHLLGPERELDALLQALDGAKATNEVRSVTEHLLRIVFDDRRTGWGQMSYYILREDGRAPDEADFGKNLVRLMLRVLGFTVLATAFPWLVRRRLKKLAKSRKGREKIEYWGLKGEAPRIPAELSANQRRVLLACADKPELWQFHTNLWELFNLPNNAAELRAFANETTAK